jgi:hypothetical protein
MKQNELAPVLRHRCSIGAFERGQTELPPATIRRLKRALESAGVIFTPENGDGPEVKLGKAQWP